MRFTTADRNRQIITTGFGILALILFIVGRVHAQTPLVYTGDALQFSLLDSMGIGSWMWIPIVGGLLAFTVWQWLPTANTIEFQRTHWFFPSLAMLLVGLYVMLQGLGMPFASALVVLVLTVVTVVLLVGLPPYLFGAKTKGQRAAITLIVDVTFGLLAGWSIYLLFSILALPVTNLGHNWFVRNFFGLLLIIAFGTVLLLVGYVAGNRISIYFAGMWPLLFMVFANLFIVGGSILAGLVSLLVLCASIFCLTLIGKHKSFKL
ncbi:hypothetical protein KRX54_00670 [Actinomycetaceae bacterium TAE3-ERU4]|nr:hypothetical protein [Actinomycetaceae bacterium TAE3-ERU4]